MTTDNPQGTGQSEETDLLLQALQDAVREHQEILQRQSALITRLRQDISDLKDVRPT